MNYHVIISQTYWPLKYAQWKRLSSEEQRIRTEQHLTEIYQMLKDGKTTDEVKMLTSGEGLITLIPDHGQILPLDGLPHTGVDHIAYERMEQLAKHPYNAEHDDVLNSDEQLITAAVAVLTENREHWPKSWNHFGFLRATEKSTVGRLAVAGALIAAEMDRLLRAQVKAARLPAEPALVRAGTVVRIRDGYDQYLNAPEHGQPLCDAYPALKDQERHVLAARRGADHVVMVTIALEPKDINPVTIDVPFWLLQVVTPSNTTPNPKN